MNRNVIFRGKATDAYLTAKRSLPGTDKKFATSKDLYKVSQLPKNSGNYPYTSSTTIWLGKKNDEWYVRVVDGFEPLEYHTQETKLLWTPSMTSDWAVFDKEKFRTLSNVNLLVDVSLKSLLHDLKNTQKILQDEDLIEIAGVIESNSFLCVIYGNAVILHENLSDFIEYCIFEFERFIDGDSPDESSYVRFIDVFLWKKNGPIQRRTYLNLCSAHVSFVMYIGEPPKHIKGYVITERTYEKSFGKLLGPTEDDTYPSLGELGIFNGHYYLKYPKHKYSVDSHVYGTPQYLVHGVKKLATKTLKIEKGSSEFFLSKVVREKGRLKANAFKFDGNFRSYKKFDSIQVSFYKVEYSGLCIPLEHEVLKDYALIKKMCS